MAYLGIDRRTAVTRSWIAATSAKLAPFMMLFRRENRNKSIHRTALIWRLRAHAHHVTRHNTAIHNILSTAPQLSISQKTLGTLHDDSNVMSKHVGATIHN
jgi:hypothetical protein